MKLVKAMFTKKTRKNHVCVYCGNVIKKGEAALVNRYAIKGGIDNAYFHPENCKRKK